MRLLGRPLAAEFSRYTSTRCRSRLRIGGHDAGGVYRSVSRGPEGGYVAFVEELPGANTQGDTLDEARENLREAVTLVLEATRALAKEELCGAKVIREPLRLPA